MAKNTFSLETKVPFEKPMFTFYVFVLVIGIQLWASSKIVFSCFPFPQKCQLVSEEFTWMSQPSCMFELCLFLISGPITYIFSSSGFYEGMSQHLNILSVLQFKYLKFYMYSKRYFRMRVLEVYLWNWHLIFLVFLTCPPTSAIWNLNDDNVSKNTIKK